MEICANCKRWEFWESKAAKNIILHSAEKDNSFIEQSFITYVILVQGVSVLRQLYIITHPLDYPHLSWHVSLWLGVCVGFYLCVYSTMYLDHYVDLSKL